MSTAKTTTIDLESSKQRLRRYTIFIINAFTLIGTILLITWVLGKIIAVLHALVFSLALSDTPDQFLESFRLPENAFTNIEVQSAVEGASGTSEQTALYTAQQNDWRR